MSSQNIESHLVENARLPALRRIFQKGAHREHGGVSRRSGRSRSSSRRNSGRARPRSFTGRSRGRRCSSGSEPFAKWFIGGKLNVSENCLDRHLGTARQNKAAIIWEGEPGEKRTLTYQQLHREVCRFANVLKRQRHREGRPRADLPADGAGGGDRDAGLRAHRRDALGGLRRVLARRASRIGSRIRRR